MNDHIKMAVYLMHAPWEEATKIINRLRDTDLKKVVALMSVMETSPTCRAEKGGHGHSLEGSITEGAVIGGPKRAKSFLQSGLKLASASVKSARTPWPLLQNLPAETVGRLLEKEHPQTIGLILGHLEATHAAQIMEIFSPMLQSQVTRCMVGQRHPTPEALHAIEAALLEHLASLGLDREDGITGNRMDVSSLTTLLKRQSPEWASHILQRLDCDDAVLAERIGRGLTVFEDLILLDNRSIQQLLRLIDLNDLYCALSNASPALTDRFFNNMSQRVRHLNREDMESKPSPSCQDIQAARIRIVERASHLLLNGIITMCGKGNHPSQRFKSGHDIHPVMQNLK